MSDVSWYVSQLVPLIGWKIVLINQDMAGEYYGLILEKNGKRKVLWILRDDEGNGPGSFEIQEIET